MRATQWAPVTSWVDLNTTAKGPFIFYTIFTVMSQCEMESVLKMESDHDKSGASNILQVEEVWRELSFELAMRSNGVPYDFACGYHQSVIDCEVSAASLVSSEVAPCPLCPLSQISPCPPKIMRRHLSRFHERHSFSYKGKKFLLCRLPCMTHKRSHYHCICGRKTRLRSTAERHIQICPEFKVNIEDETESERGVCDEHPPEATDQPITVENCVPSTKSSDSQPVCSTVNENIKPTKDTTLECNVCKRTVSRKNIRRHLRTHQRDSSSSHQVCCVDKKGIFLVDKHSGTGPVAPIHVKVRTFGDDSGLVCTEGECMEIMLAMKRGQQNFVCQHLSKAINAPNVTGDCNLPLISNVLMSSEMRALVVNLKNEADMHQTSLIARWPYSVQPNVTFFSVYTGIVRPWSQLGRTVVTLRNGYISCPCVGSLHNCVHKAAVRWVQNLSEGNETPATLSSVPSESESNGDVDIFNHHWLDFLSKKKIDPDSCQEFDNSVEFAPLMPSEAECPWCSSPMDLRVSSEKGTILDQHFIRHDVKVFEKICTTCAHFVRYHDTHDGLFNCNNRLFLTTRFCKWIRCCIQTHTAVGRELEKLQLYLQVRLPPHQDIIKGYFMYESLCDHTYDYVCISCGIYPPIIITDVNKKCSFRLNLPDVGGRDEALDTVNQQEFWTRVEKQILAAHQGSDDDVVPSYSCWSPYIGGARSGSDVVNTEFKKGSGSGSRTAVDDDENEVELSEDLLIELISEKKLPDIKKVCKSIGVLDSGTKLECLNRIKDRIKDQTCFDKIFTKFSGRSGGLLAACCPHGIIYAIKFLLRGESPRDHVDLLMSFKHQPTLVICDIPGFVSLHGNKRKPSMFHPNDGRFAQCTEENLALLKVRALTVDIPELNMSNVMFNITSVDHSYSDNRHPLTNSRDHYCAYDRFHQNNSTNEKEKLRRLDIVRGLQGTVNTQVVEELFSSLDKSKYFLNQMKAVNHVFAVRLLLHLQNMRKNQDRRALIEKSIKASHPDCELSFGSDKRIIISATKTTEAIKVSPASGPTQQEANSDPTRAASLMGDQKPLGILKTSGLIKKRKRVHFVHSPATEIWAIAKKAPRHHILARQVPYPLTTEDFVSLQGTAWLTDQVMDAYLHMITAKSSVGAILHLPSQTMTAILDGDKPPLMRWVKFHDFHTVVGVYLQGRAHWTSVKIHGSP